VSPFLEEKKGSREARKEGPAETWVNQWASTRVQNRITGLIRKGGEGSSLHGTRGGSRFGGYKKSQCYRKEGGEPGLWLVVNRI